MANQQDTGDQDTTRPEHTEVATPPTVASVATVASTTDDLEAAEPSHPDRPVGVNVDTAGLGLDEAEQLDSPDPEGDGAQPQDVELDDTGLMQGDDERFGGGHVGAGVPDVAPESDSRGSGVLGAEEYDDEQLDAQDDER